MMEHDIAHGVNVVRLKYSNDPNFKEKPHFLKFCKKILPSGHRNSSCPDKRQPTPLENPNFHKKIFNQAMKGNQNLPNKPPSRNGSP